MRKNFKSNNRGITLVALVVTLVIMIILATVTISATFGENGIIKQAEKAKDLTSNAIAKENEDMNELLEEYANIMADDGEIPEPGPGEDKTPPTVNEITTSNITENSITVTVNATDDSGEIASYKYFLNGVEQTTIQTNTYTFTGLTAGTEYTIKVEAFDKANNKGEKTITVSTLTPPSIPTTNSYVGYYADIEGDGNIDGIIYADLAKGNTGDGQWGNSNYTIPKKKNLKEYYISKKSYSDDFGTKDVISPVKKDQSGKNDRFYIMALNDIDAKTHYWYKSAAGIMSLDTSTAFGTGKQNTQTMISQWNSNKYPPQDNNDMWKLIQTQANNGWFVPSREEWSAFGEELGITESNYPQKGLSDWYWSSSQEEAYVVMGARFDGGYMIHTNVNDIHYVRLSATF